jgi:hypothetical protein
MTNREVRISMKSLLSVTVAALLLTMFTACPINNWSARQVLWDQGYNDIYFGEVPDDENQYAFFARRGEEHCSGIVDIGGSEPVIRAHCGVVVSATAH